MKKHTTQELISEPGTSSPVEELKALVKQGDTKRLLYRLDRLGPLFDGLAQENVALREQMAITDLSREKLLRGFEAGKAQYQAVQSVFVKFRDAARMVQQIKKHDEIAPVLGRLRGEFQLDAISLVLSPEYRMDRPELATMLSGEGPELGVAKRLFTDREAVMIRTDVIENLSRFFDERILREFPRLRNGSVFLYPMIDKYDPSRVIGILGFASRDTLRFSEEKDSDFLEHFCEILTSVIVDITDRKRADDLREDMERMTRHDLKSPLNAILTLPKLLLQSDDFTPRQQEMLELIQDAGYRMLDMINLSLSLYKMEKKSYPIVTKPLDVLVVLEKIRSDLSGLFSAMEVDMVIVVNERARQVDDEFIIFGEEILCYTMLANLVKNAVEASKEGQPVTIQLHKNTFAEMSMHNSGVVQNDVRESFFEKYTTCGKQDGTGLGTYGAKLIAEAHGGTIAMTTSENEGTTVIVKFPLHPPSSNWPIADAE